jgi:hypothetical protein
MRRGLVILVAALTLTVAMAAPVAARGVTAERLADAGWDCFPVPGLGVHCMPPGVDWGDRQIQLLYFDETTGEFAGTETLVRADAFQGNRQCPTETGGWFFIPPLGYYGCHRN